METTETHSFSVDSVISVFFLSWPVPPGVALGLGIGGRIVDGVLGGRETNSGWSCQAFSGVVGMADARRWYVRTDSGPVGPFTSNELRDQLSRGEISPHDAIRHGERGVWIAAVRLLPTTPASAAPPITTGTRLETSNEPPPLPASRLTRIQRDAEQGVSKVLLVALALMLLIGVGLGIFVSEFVRDSVVTHSETNERLIASAPPQPIASGTDADRTLKGAETSAREDSSSSGELRHRQSPPAADSRPAAEGDELEKPISDSSDAGGTDEPRGLDAPPNDSISANIFETPNDSRKTELDRDSVLDAGETAQQAGEMDGAMEAGVDGDPLQEPAVEEPEKPMLPAAAQPRTVRFQELTIQRMPQLSVLGTMLSQDLHYQILSELQISAPDSEGARDVSQTILGTRLLRADPLSQATYARSLKELEGWQFEFRVNRYGEVIQWKAGPREGRGLSDVVLGEQSGFLVSTVLDEDGWKEIERLCFFTPLDEVEEGASFERQMTHDYGALGSWSGETVFRRANRASDQRYVYEHRVRHRPRAADAPEIPGLPLKVVSIEMETRTADGAIERDVQTGWVEQASERFDVVGRLSAETLGGVAELEFQESQATTIFMLDRNPWLRP